MRNTFEKGVRGMLRCGIAATLILGGGGIARADVITLTDGNSSAIVNTDPSDSPFRAGMINWTVDGVNKLYDQWFGFRYQNMDLSEPGGVTVSGALDSLGAPVITGSATQLGGGNDLTLAYNNHEIAVSVAYVLTGGSAGSETASIDETITITNLMDRWLQGEHDLRFFQYSDFDLCGPGSADSVTIGYGSATQTSSCNSIVAETTINPIAGMADYNGGVGPGFTAGTPFDVGLAALHGIDLDNNSSFSGDNAAWAFEWGIPFDPYGKGWDTVTIHKTKSLAPVPEPMSLALLGAGLVGVGQMVRRRRTEAAVA